MINEQEFEHSFSLQTTFLVKFFSYQEGQRLHCPLRLCHSLPILARRAKDNFNATPIE
jgi:hypothetical protein